MNTFILFLFIITSLLSPSGIPPSEVIIEADHNPIVITVKPDDVDQPIHYTIERTGQDVVHISSTIGSQLFIYYPEHQTLYGEITVTAENDYGSVTESATFSSSTIFIPIAVN